MSLQVNSQITDTDANQKTSELISPRHGLSQKLKLPSIVWHPKPPSSRPPTRLHANRAIRPLCLQKPSVRDRLDDAFLESKTGSEGLNLRPQELRHRAREQRAAMRRLASLRAMGTTPMVTTNPPANASHTRMQPHPPNHPLIRDSLEAALIVSPITSQETRIQPKRQVEAKTKLASPCPTKTSPQTIGNLSPEAPSTRRMSAIKIKFSSDPKMKRLISATHPASAAQTAIAKYSPKQPENTFTKPNHMQTVANAVNRGSQKLLKANGAVFKLSTNIPIQAAEAHKKL